jgi:adenylate cyclase
VITPPLESLATCFQGLLPAQLFTCSRDGVPNAAYLSHVDYVDSSHVALSFQFFNKSRRNVAENPNALIIVVDPDTGQGWQLRIRYVRSETEGPLFDRMALRIEAIASYCGLKGIFKLRASDIYEVRSIETAPETMGVPSEDTIDRDIRAAAQTPVFTLKAMQDLAQRIQEADCLEKLVDSILAGLDHSFGFRHSMILVPGEEPGVLVTIATRGYPQNGAGAEVRYGEGIAGLVAEARQPIRISGLLRGILYAYAMHQAEAHPDPERERRRIPMPALANPESQLGVPLLVRGELVGVLCLESEVRYRFHEEDKASLELLGNYLAIAIQNVQLQDASLVPAETTVVAQAESSATNGRHHDLVYYAGDEVIMVDGEYLIRSLPARILWRLLTTRHTSGREEFTNRELRLDKSLNLPEWKDNLESRLILLRRRLEQKCQDIRIAPIGRGRFRLAVDCDVSLSTRP